MIVVEGKGRYIDRRAGLNRRKAKVDKQRRRAEGVFNLLAGALLAFVPMLLQADTVPALLIYISSVCFMATGTKRIMKG